MFQEILGGFLEVGALALTFLGGGASLHGVSSRESRFLFRAVGDVSSRGSVTLGEMHPVVPDEGLDGGEDDGLGELDVALEVSAGRGGTKLLLEYEEADIGGGEVVTHSVYLVGLVKSEAPTTKTQSHSAGTKVRNVLSGTPRTRGVLYRGGLKVKGKKRFSFLF